MLQTYQSLEPLTSRQQAKAYKAYKHNRKIVPGLASGMLLNVDMLGGHVKFLGLKRDSEYIKERFGWDDPTVFIAEFGP